MPGVGLENTVYAHTSKKLYTMNIKSFEVKEVGTIQWPGNAKSKSMTDLAIDGYGVLYAVSFSDVFTCHPTTVKCTKLADLNSSFNGLTLVPKGVIDQNKEVLIGISNSGLWTRIDVDGTTAKLTNLGKYGTGYSSSGDAFSIENVGTYAAVNKAGTAADVIVIVNPVNGQVTGELAVLSVATANGGKKNYSSTYGLAGWLGSVFAFDASGHILRVDLLDGSVEVIKQTNIGWWGAGVRTRLFGLAP
jgi:hypothetical protein